MVPLFVLIAAFAAANFAYLAFDSDSYAFEVAMLALGLSTRGIALHTAAIVERLQLPNNATSITLNTGSVFYYYNKAKIPKLSIGPISRSLALDAPPSLAAITRWTPRLPHRFPLTAANSFDNDLQLSADMYNSTPALLSSGRPFIPELFYSLSAPISRNDTCPSDDRLVVQWTTSKCCESDALSVEEDLYIFDLELYPPPVEVKYLGNTCRLPLPLFESQAPAPRCNLLDAPALGTDTCPVTNHLLAICNHGCSSFEETQDALHYEHSLSPRETGHMNEPRMLPLPPSSYHITPEFPHSLGATMPRNDTCPSDGRPVMNWPVCDRRDSGPPATIAAPYVSAPELYLCPAQIANVDGTWAILGMPDLCSHSSGPFNCRVGLLTMILLLFTVSISRRLFSFSTEVVETPKAPIYILSAVQTHWTVDTKPINNEEEKKQLWIEFVSSSCTRAIYTSDEEIQNGVPEIEFEQVDGDNGLLHDTTTLPPSSPPAESVLQSKDSEVRTTIDDELCVHSSGDLTSFNSDMSLASLYGGISDACDDYTCAGTDDFPGSSISNFVFTFTFGIDGRPLNTSFNCEPRMVSGDVGEESKNIALWPDKPQLQDKPTDTKGSFLHQNETTETTGVFHTCFTLMAYYDLCNNTKFGVHNPKSTELALDAGNNNLRTKIGSSLTRDLGYPGNVEIPPAKRRKRLEPDVGPAETQGNARYRLVELCRRGADKNMESSKPVASEKAKKRRVKDISIGLFETLIRLVKREKARPVRLYRKVFKRPSTARRSRLGSIDEEDEQTEANEQTLESSSGDLTIVPLELELQQDTPTKPRMDTQSGSHQHIGSFNYEARGSYFDFDSDEDENDSKLEDHGHRILRATNRYEDAKASDNAIAPRIPPLRPSRVGVPPLGICGSGYLPNLGVDESDQEVTRPKRPSRAGVPSLLDYLTWLSYRESSAEELRRRQAEDLRRMQ
ncbi:hypothetical protein FRC07_012476 [Ceratobasidium sp. 392]|nr:hypothetical protein FRC07_012476 [Ceratobasidium sp. 392]